MPLQNRVDPYGGDRPGIARRTGRTRWGQDHLQGASGTLPLGTFIEHAFLITDDALLPWSFESYGQPVLLPDPGSLMTVFTPASIVALFRDAGATLRRVA